MNEITSVSQSDLEDIQALPLGQNPAAVYLVGLKPSGRYTQRQMLNVVARLLGTPETHKPPEERKKKGEEITWLFCDWAAIRFQHVAAIRAKLEETEKPATVNKALAAVRGVLFNAWRLEQMTAEEYQKAKSVKGIKNITLPAGRELTEGEKAALMAVCENDSTPAGVRDAAIIGMALIAGLRRHELAGLDLADYDPESGKLVIRGKGNKERTGYLNNGAARAMADWLAVRGNQEGALFQPVNKGGRILPQRITPQAVYNLLDKRGKQAGIANFSSHDLRRTWISDLLDVGADISTVAKMAGHASVITTQRYDRRPEEAKRKAAGLLHLPYRGRLT